MYVCMYVGTYVYVYVRDAQTDLSLKIALT
jgi:hypothetical protein